MDLIIFFVIAFVSVMVVMTVMAVFRGFCMQLHVSALRDNRPERPHRLPKILTLNGDRRINLSVKSLHFSSILILITVERAMGLATGDSESALTTCKGASSRWRLCIGRQDQSRMNMSTIVHIVVT